MLPMSYKKNEPDEFGFVQWLGVGLITVGIPAGAVLILCCPDRREEDRKKQRERIKLLEATLSTYEQQTETLPSNHGEK